MANHEPQRELSQPPARLLRLLAGIAPAGTLVSGLLTAWVIIGTLHDLGQPMTPPVVFALVVGALFAGFGCLVTYRFAVGVPRLVLQWQAALVERTQALRDR